MNESLHIIVSGRVQGVYFRAFTQKQARQLNLTGYAKNLSNGDVEIVASGEKHRLDQLVDWCRKGPITARVDSVRVRSMEDAPYFSAFEIR